MPRTPLPTCVATSTQSYTGFCCCCCCASAWATPPSGDGGGGVQGLGGATVSAAAASDCGVVQRRRLSRGPGVAPALLLLPLHVITGGVRGVPRGVRGLAHQSAAAAVPLGL